MYWLALIVFVAHMLEEYPRFAEWATRHFAPTSKAWYFYSHVVLVILALLVCLRAEQALPHSWPRILGTAFMVTLGMNAVFHLATTFLFREYSPGVVTGTCLFLPATSYLLFLTVRDSILTTTEIGGATALGAVTQVAVIASLFIRTDFSWRFRRRRHNAAPVQ